MTDFNVRLQSRAMTTLGFKYHPMADHPGQENHESVDYPLNQSQGDHVAVSHMADFMAQYRF